MTKQHAATIEERQYQTGRVGRVGHVIQNREMFDSMRKAATEGPAPATPWNLGISLPTYNRLVNGGDWTFLELGLGRLMDTFTGDKYGDVFYLDEEGCFSNTPTAVSMTFTREGKYATSFYGAKDSYYHWKDGIDHLKGCLHSCRAAEPPRPSNPSADTHDPWAVCPHAMKIPWTTARVLSFRLPAETFCNDARAFASAPPAADKLDLALMALVTTFVNMSLEDRERCKQLWDDIVTALKRS